LSRRAALEKRIGHRFAAPRLLEDALARGSRPHERLEFLGDAVLACVVAEELYGRFASIPEGSLHRLREALIREEALARLARELGLEEILLATVPQATASALADTLEAVLGAMFLDGGYSAARKSVLKIFGAMFDDLDPENLDKDAKSRLQEIVQGRFKTVPSYRLVSQSGRAHQPSFEIECLIAELSLATTGSGTSRQRAEQQAASAMLEKLAR